MHFKVYLWGTGRLAGKVVGKYIAVEQIEAFIDNDESKQEYMGRPVITPDALLTREYDAVLVANLYREQIYRQCAALGIDMDKVIFLYANCDLKDVNQNYALAEQVLGKEYAGVIKNRYHVVRGVEAFGKPYSSRELESVGGGQTYQHSDYVRIECFELAVKEIYKKGLKGSTAELGVFRGEFAQYINAAFPDRRCYLFDTFEGFDAGEALRELKSGNCTDAFVQAYKQTNLAAVMERMRYPDNIVIKQGYFPESLEGLEDRFCFVSLDADFEESIYAGLAYFYPRMEQGGYIFVHDYNSDLRGVEQAVDRYEADSGEMLCRMPLCDANGTLVVVKG